MPPIYLRAMRCHPERRAQPAAKDPCFFAKHDHQIFKGLVVHSSIWCMVRMKAGKLKMNRGLTL